MNNRLQNSKTVHVCVCGRNIIPYRFLCRNDIRQIIVMSMEYSYFKCYVDSAGILVYNIIWKRGVKYHADIKQIHTCRSYFYLYRHF